MHDDELVKTTIIELNNAIKSLQTLQTRGYATHYMIDSINVLIKILNDKLNDMEHFKYL